MGYPSSGRSGRSGRSDRSDLSGRSLRSGLADTAGYQSRAASFEFLLVNGLQPNIEWPRLASICPWPTKPANCMHSGANVVNLVEYDTSS